MNIADYIQSAKEGSQEAIAALFDEYKKTVWFLARILTGDESDAENVLQYTFYQAFHRINVLKKPENFGMWLIIIAANRCRFLLQKKHPMSFIQNDGQKTPKVKLTVVNTPVDTALALDSDACEQISAVCDRLPDQLRFCELLYFYAQMSTSQIAKIMECDEAKVKLAITRAEAQIKSELEAISGKYPSLSDYGGAGELFPILSACAERAVIKESFANDIIATSVTLALSAPASRSEKHDEQTDAPASNTSDSGAAVSESESPHAETELSDSTESPIPEALSESVPVISEEDEKAEVFDDKRGGESDAGSVNADTRKMDAEKRAAIRNIATIAIVLILAASIIIGSVIIIKNAADAIQLPVNTTDDADTGEADSVSESEPATDELTADGDAETEPSEPATEPPVETEPPAQVQPTEPVTEPPVETEPPKPAQPAQPSATEPELSMTQAEADAVFTSRDANGAVTITGYISGGKEVDIPATINGHPVTAIGFEAFRGNTTIVSVIVPSTVTEIGDSAFYGCSSLTDIQLSPNLKKLGTYAFYYCDNLATIRLPATLSFVGTSVFSETKWIEAQKNDFVTAGDGVLIKYIGKDADITVPANVKFISNAFYYNTAVKSVILQSGVTELGQFAFCGCTKLTSITLPDTLTAIDKNAIYENKLLTEIYVKTGSYAESWCKENGFSALIKKF